MDNETEIDRLSNKLENKYIGFEPMLLIAVIALLIIYYYLFSSLGNNEDGNSSIFKVIFETGLWILFIILLLLNGISYIFGIDLIRTLKVWFGYEKDKNIVNDTKNDDDDIKVRLKEQVFHLPEKNYSYEDAKAVCNAYDARLATFDEVEAAYNKGADWCNYGWSEGQMALYPTQTEKWEKLQKREGHEKDCGRPGINGGYMDDIKIKYGANCYGAKPSITKEEANCMRNTPKINKNDKEKAFDKQVDYWRTKVSQIVISPFNHDNWSMI
jgi:hypothetical protein